jgi:fumarylpyruvate hydrolase
MTVPVVAATSIPIAGTEERFPVRRVYCVGRNFRDHALEMGGDPDREPPFFFAKPADAIVDPTEHAIPFPTRTAKLGHEVELVVAVGATADHVSSEQALDAVWGYTVGIDLTRRDLQDAAKKAGRPWETSKGFDYSGPVAPIVRVAESGHPSSGRIWLEVNGESRQDGDLTELIWSVPEVIAELSTYFVLQPGDLIFTGTPAGVGLLVAGDSISAGIDGVAAVTFTIDPA